MNGKQTLVLCPTTAAQEPKPEQAPPAAAAPRDWPSVGADERLRYVMERLVNQYGRAAADIAEPFVDPADEVVVVGTGVMRVTQARAGCRAARAWT